MEIVLIWSNTLRTCHSTEYTVVHHIPFRFALRYLSLVFPNLENEVDRKTLFLMDSIDKITTIIPKLKNQLLFLKEREELFDKTAVIREKEKGDDAPCNIASENFSSLTNSSLF